MYSRECLLSFFVLVAQAFQPALGHRLESLCDCFFIFLY